MNEYVEADADYGDTAGDRISPSFEWDETIGAEGSALL